jgi:hypothetical protein
MRNIVCHNPSSMKHYFLTFLFSLLLLTSCMNVRQITKGNLPENESFNFYFYNYVSVSSKQKKLFNNCKVYLTHIKNSQKKTKEIIVWYSCDSLLPIKFFAGTDSVSGKPKVNYMIADTSKNFIIPINDEEKEVLLTTNKYLSNLGYPTYDIKGFKFLTTEVTTTGLPFLAPTLKYYRK